MVKIRLARTGRRNQASFRIVVQEVTSAPTGKYIELLGHYNPRLKEREINVERALYWIEHGAQLTPTVQNLLVREGAIKADKVRSWAPKTRPTAEDEDAGKSQDNAEAGAEKNPPAGGEEVAPAAEAPKEGDAKADGPAPEEEKKEESSEKASPEAKAEGEDK